MTRFVGTFFPLQVARSPDPWRQGFNKDYCYLCWEHSRVITAETFITHKSKCYYSSNGSKCYYRWDLYYTWVQLLHLCLLQPPFAWNEQNRLKPGTTRFQTNRWMLKPAQIGVNILIVAYNYAYSRRICPLEFFIVWLFPFSHRIFFVITLVRTISYNQGHLTWVTQLW